MAHCHNEEVEVRDKLSRDAREEAFLRRLWDLDASQMIGERLTLLFVDADHYKYL